MMGQRQLPSQICSTEPVSMPVDILQDKCTIPTPYESNIMCYYPICQKQPGSKGTVFFSNISYTIYICIPIAVTSNHWIKPPDMRISNDNNLPRQGH